MVLRSSICLALFFYNEAPHTSLAQYPWVSGNCWDVEWDMMRYNYGHTPLCPILFPSHLDTLSPLLSFTLPLSLLHPLAWFGLSSLITFHSLLLLRILLFSIVLWFLVVTSLCPTADIFHFLPLSTIILYLLSGLYCMKVFEGGGSLGGWCRGVSICWRVSRIARQTFHLRGAQLFGMMWWISVIWKWTFIRSSFHSQSRL